MRAIILLCLFLFVSEAYSQQKPQVASNQKKSMPCDTIVRFGNRKIPVTKLTVGAGPTVSYALISKPDSMIRLEKKEIEKIIYKNGSKQEMNKSVIQEASAWQSVLITRDRSDVQGLYNRGEISARSTPSAKTKKKAEDGVRSKLQKMAAVKKGTYVLIVHDEFDNNYGEVPGYYAEAIIYGPEPLEVGTDVVDKKGATKK